MRANVKVSSNKDNVIKELDFDAIIENFRKAHIPIPLKLYMAAGGIDFQYLEHSLLQEKNIKDVATKEDLSFFATQYNG